MTEATNQEQQTDNTNTVPAAGTPEYDQYMLNAAARGRENNGQEPYQAQQQEDDKKLPEGVSMDDLLAAYQAQQEAQQNSESDDEKGGDQNLSGQDDQSTDNGQSDPNTDDALQNRVRDLENQIVTEKVYTAAGGEEAYKALQERAGKELSEVENNMLSEVLEKGSAAEAVAAVQMLQRLLGADTSVETHGRFVGGQPTPTDNAFANRSELHAAQADPRYRDKGPVGEAYRRDIEQKLSRSRFY